MHKNAQANIALLPSAAANLGQLQPSTSSYSQLDQNDTKKVTPVATVTPPPPTQGVELPVVETSVKGEIQNNPKNQIPQRADDRI